MIYVLTDDPPEYNKLYLIPGLACLGGYLACTQGNYPDIHQAAYLAASLCCVGALTGLSSQSTSRIGKITSMVNSISYTNIYIICGGVKYII